MSTPLDPPTEVFPVVTAEAPLEPAEVKAALESPYLTLEARAGLAEALGATPPAVVAVPAEAPDGVTVPPGATYHRLEPADIARAFDVPLGLVDPAALSQWAQALHAAVCGCPNDGSDVAGHGLDYQIAAGKFVGALVAALPPVEHHPVEAKVTAGTWGTFAASVGIVLATMLLGHLEVIPSLLGGDSPWVGVLVLSLGAVLPTVVQFLRAYNAEHTPRPADALISAVQVLR